MTTTTRLRGVAAGCAVVIICLISVALFDVAAPANSRPRRVTQSAEDCGLPPHDAKLEAKDLPPFGRMRGAEVVAMSNSGPWASGSVNVPLSVAELRDVIDERIRSSDYRVFHEDYEGFEAEFFVEIDGESGVIRMARSRCDDFSSLSFQLPLRKST